MTDSTVYFSVTVAMVKRKIPDTDASDSDILAEAQVQEYRVMSGEKLGLSAATGNTITDAVIAHAITLYAAAELETREPHSEAEGGVRVDKYNRISWKQEADAIIDKLRTSGHVVATSLQTDKIRTRWGE